MSFLSALGKIASTAAPIAGLIPGVGPLAAGIMGAGGKLLQGSSNLGAIAGAGLEGAAGGEAGNLLSGADSIGNLTHNLGSMITDPKKAGAIGGIMNLIGTQNQRNSAQNYANGVIGQRNALMQKAMQPIDYGNMNLSGTPSMISKNPNLNQQSSATSAGY